MKIVLGLAFTSVILIFLLHIIVQSVRRRKIVPLAIVLAVVGVYFYSYHNNYVYYFTWILLLIPQILFLLYVFIFMLISLKKKIDSNAINNFDNHNLPSVSIVIAVHNEENVVERTITNLLNLNYPKHLYNITFIDDFSNDNTVDLLLGFKDVIQVIDRKNNERKRTKVKRGKPSAINENIDKLNGELICILDADSIIENDFLLKLTPEFKNEKLGLIQARNVFYNKNKNLMSLLTSLDIYSMQHTIYIPLSRLGFGMFEGRAAIFRKKVFKELKGFDVNLPGEDFDFGYRVGISGYDILYNESVYSREQVTENFDEWYKQRKRWLANHILSCFKNAKLLYNTKNINSRKKIGASFFIFNLLYAFTFNFIGSLILINEVKYNSIFPLIFIFSFSFTAIFFCLSYILTHKKYSLIILLPIMILYYWIFTIIQTWIFINEIILNKELFYKKALHRKPLLHEI